MVLFTSISRSITVVSILFLGLSDATKSNKNNQVPHIVGPSNATDLLPPFIASRTQPAASPNFEVNLNAEAESIEKNLKWFTDHGGDIKSITKRDTEIVGNLTMEVPDNAPPAEIKSSSSIVLATKTQINNFKLYAGLAAAPYCRKVVPGGQWTCKNCKKYVPDGKLLVTFSTLLSDSNGFVLRSDAQKTIHLVFRGTNSIRSTIVVRPYI